MLELSVPVPAHQTYCNIMPQGFGQNLQNSHCFVLLFLLTKLAISSCAQKQKSVFQTHSYHTNIQCILMVSIFNSVYLQVCNTLFKHCSRGLLQEMFASEKLVN